MFFTFPRPFCAREHFSGDEKNNGVSDSIINENRDNITWRQKSLRGYGNNSGRREFKICNIVNKIKKKNQNQMIKILKKINAISF